MINIIPKANTKALRIETKKQTDRGYGPTRTYSVSLVKKYKLFITFWFYSRFYGENQAKRKSFSLTTEEVRTGTTV